MGAPLRQDMREPGAVISAVTRPNDRADPALLISSPFRDFVGKATRPTRTRRRTRRWTGCAAGSVGSYNESQGSARDSAIAAMRLPAATAATSLYCWALLLAEVLPASASAGSAAVWLPQQDSWRPYSPWSACLRPAHEHCETERGRGCGGQVASSKGSEVLEDHGVNVGGFIFG